MHEGQTKLWKAILDCFSIHLLHTTFFHVSFLVSHLFQIESLLKHKSFHCFVHSRHTSLYFSSSPSLGERGIKTACNIQALCTTRTACSVLIQSALTDARWAVFPRRISWHLSTLNIIGSSFSIMGCGGAMLALC